MLDRRAAACEPLPKRAHRSAPEGALAALRLPATSGTASTSATRQARASARSVDRRIAKPLEGGTRFVPVLSRKGGVGKTTVTTLLGMALADARDDRIIAIDANPDRGTLAERVSQQTRKTVRDLVHARADDHRLQRLLEPSSPATRPGSTSSPPTPTRCSPRRSTTNDYHDVADLAAHYYSIVLTDTGTGIVHSVMGATLAARRLRSSSSSGGSVDEARLASETLTWLETNGYADQVRNAIVVLNTRRPRAPPRASSTSSRRTSARACATSCASRTTRTSRPAARSRSATCSPPPGQRRATSRRSSSRACRTASRRMTWLAWLFGPSASSATPCCARRPTPIDEIDDGVRALVATSRHRRAARSRRRRRAADRRRPARLQLQHRRRDRLRAQPRARRGRRASRSSSSEGCLSVPGLWHDALRHPRATVTGHRPRRQRGRARGRGPAWRRRCSTRPTTSTASSTSTGLDARDERDAMREIRESDWF